MLRKLVPAIVLVFVLAATACQPATLHPGQLETDNAAWPPLQYPVGNTTDWMFISMTLEQLHQFTDNTSSQFVQGRVCFPAVAPGGFPRLYLDRIITDNVHVYELTYVSWCTAYETLGNHDFGVFGWKKHVVVSPGESVQIQLRVLHNLATADLTSGANIKVATQDESTTWWQSV